MMEAAAQSGSHRREERIPLDVLVELCADEETRVEADALNVSMGGMALRAPISPPLGSVLECRFPCPPSGELVSAQGEVSWVAERGPELGSFGVRFVELDTKSAAALQRYLGDSRRDEPDRLRTATLLIDGLEASVDAELKLADESRIVLEQQLSFLQLGRGVEVQLLGRDKERGRIASVELRHTDFDVPTLVFGILLDGASERPSAPSVSHGAPLFNDTPTIQLSPELASAAYASGEDAVAYESAQPISETTARTAVPPRNVRTRERASSPPALRSSWTALRLELKKLRARFALGWGELKGANQAFANGASPDDARDFRTGALLRLARMRATTLRLVGREPAPQARVSRPPPLRVQRTTLPGIGGPTIVALPSAGRARIMVTVLAVLVVGLVAFALVPRQQEQAERAPQQQPELAAVAEPPPGPPALPTPEPTEPLPEAAPAAASEPFGDEEVPNGRVFVLRMNGPVSKLQGEATETGFKVRIPKRRASDPARPIADAHPALARSLILNRGAYAELTIDFLPGLRPRYQVVGKGNTLEITIERL